MSHQPQSERPRYDQDRMASGKPKSLSSNALPDDLKAALAQEKALAQAERPGYTPVEWATLVDQIKAGEEAGMENLYKLFSRGIRYYLCRQLGPQELEDKVHDTFLIVVNAIRRGDLSEPDRLMGFVRTVVRRQVAAYIEQAVHNRREQTDLETGVAVADRRQNPEQEAMVRQKTELMKSALLSLPQQDREILVRFYLKEQSQEQICREMDLTETQFRLLKARAKARFGEVGKKKLAAAGKAAPVLARRVAKQVGASGEQAEIVPSLYVSYLMEDPTVQILMAAAAAFQNIETGRSWLLTPSPSLGNVPPMKLITTQSGREMVTNELGLIEHGMF
jgi:RNA polymerase sigma-70 factor, ECF subfamily